MLQCVYNNTPGCSDTEKAVVDAAIQEKMEVGMELNCPTSVRSPCFEEDDCVSR